MNACGLRAAVGLDALAWCVAANASASEAIGTDQFMRESKSGAAGLLHGTDKNVKSGPQNGAIQLARDHQYPLSLNIRQAR